jgi:hypothetical protein
MNQLIDRIVECYDEDDLLRLEGFDDAVIGIEDNTSRLIYSYKKIIDVLVNTGLTLDDARQYYDYAIGCAYIGANTPIICQDDFIY